MLMSSTPSFVLGLASIYIFAVWLDILPSGGIQTLGEEPTVRDFLEHLILPAMVLGLGARRAAAALHAGARCSRCSTATTSPRREAKGLEPERRGPAPRVPQLADPDHHGRSGCCCRSWWPAPSSPSRSSPGPAWAQLAVRAARDRDPALMMGVVLVVGIAVLITNIIVDVLYARVDPRIRFGRGN